MMNIGRRSLGALDEDLALASTQRLHRLDKMASARSRLKESKPAKNPSRGRVAKNERKRKKSPPLKRNRTKETKMETVSSALSGYRIPKKFNGDQTTACPLPRERNVTKRQEAAKGVNSSSDKDLAKSKENLKNQFENNEEVSSNEKSSKGKEVAKSKRCTNSKKSKSCNKVKEKNNIPTKIKNNLKKFSPRIPRGASASVSTGRQHLMKLAASPEYTPEPSGSNGMPPKRSRRKNSAPIPSSIFPTPPVRSARAALDYTTVEEDGKTWTVPKPVSVRPEPFVLPVSVEQHKVRKIEDMTILREMLKLHKIQLSNGVQISVPHTLHQPLECDYCGRSFRAKQDLRKHIFIHLDLRPHPCPLCDSRFRQRGNLKTHMTRMHAKALPAPQLFICHHCGARFFVKEAIRSHVLKHEPNKAYPCKHCNKRFVRDVLLRAHERSHHGTCRFFCYLCSASYTKRNSLNAHIKTHLGIRDLICHICGKGFTRLESIRKHILCFHQDVKRFQCPICSKWLKGHLREHMRTHVHSKPYACLECGRRFAQTSQLAVHKRSHTGIKPYNCRVCKRPFTHSNALLLHIRIHTGEKPFECAMCPQTFSQLPHMKAHMFNIHNKKEAYKCVDCGEFFKLRATLDEHRLVCMQAASQRLPWMEQLAQAHVKAEEMPVMSISKMRFLLAILLSTIADEDRLRVLGFNKRLIDDLLIDSLEATGHTPCKDTALPAVRRLRENIQLFLDWTVPPDIMSRFRKQNKTTEQLLEELTS